MYLYINRWDKVELHSTYFLSDFLQRLRVSAFCNVVLFFRKVSFSNFWKYRHSDSSHMKRFSKDILKAINRHITREWVHYSCVICFWFILSSFLFVFYCKNLLLNWQKSPSRSFCSNSSICSLPTHFAMCILFLSGAIGRE